MYEIYLTILVTFAFVTAAVLLLSHVTRWLYLLSFLAFLGAFLFLGRHFGPHASKPATLGSFNGNFKVRLKNKSTGAVIVTFQWQNRPDDGYVHQRICLCASAAIAEHFSKLTAPPAYSALRRFILDAVKGEVRSLGVSSFKVLVHDVEIKEPPRDDGDRDIFVGMVLR